jgi:hypothetical protein
MAAEPPYATITPITYTPVQLGAVAMAAGWAHSDLETAIAVGMAESSGNCVAIGPLVKGARPYGVMQVEWPTHQDLFKNGVGSGYWMDAQESYAMALTIWKSQGWSRGWATYSTGAYRLYLPQAAAAVTKLDQAIAAANGNAASAQLALVGANIEQATAKAELEWQLGIGLAYVQGTMGAATQSIGGAAVGAVVNTGSSSALVRTLEAVLGGALLLLGLYQLTRPATAPVLRTAAKLVK